ncbi:MAG: PaaI family thioesterase [Dethiobacter sp.]|jgi:acyl-CoA thioesterase|nr:MAG: PaaI family thioesterase [Dethiobacter sp.]
MDKHKKLSGSPFLELLGIKIDEAVYPRSWLILSWDGRLVNPMGTLHGGVISSLVDAALGCALLSKEEVKGIATMELKINYFRTITGGVVRAEGEIIHRRGTVAFGQARIYCENNLVALGSATYKLTI